MVERGTECYQGYSKFELIMSLFICVLVYVCVSFWVYTCMCVKEVHVIWYWEQGLRFVIIPFIHSSYTYFIHLLSLHVV